MVQFGAPAAVVEPSTVGTVVQVLIRQSFASIDTEDECVGVGGLETLRRGSHVYLSSGSFYVDTDRVGNGRFVYSKLHDGICDLNYRADVPVMPAFNLYFVGPDGNQSHTYGPVKSQSVALAKLPTIVQAVVVDMAFAT